MDLTIERWFGDIPKIAWKTPLKIESDFSWKTSEERLKLLITVNTMLSHFNAMISNTTIPS